jgi:2-aminoadipate transaminase
MYEFLRSGSLDTHLERVRREYVRRRDALDAALHVHLPEGCEWLLPEGGLSLWLRLPEELDADRVAACALDARVAVSQGRYFYVGRPRVQALRLAFATQPPDVAEEGARRLGKVIRAVAAERSTGLRTRRGRSRTALV